MFRKIFFTAFFILCVSICAKAQYFENNYLSINIPEGWEINKQDMAAIDAEIVVFLNTGEEVYNIGMVMGMDRYMDAKSVIDNGQFSDIMTSMFQDVKVHESRASKFMGRQAFTKDFEAKLDGVQFKGAFYAFDLGNSSIIIIGAYKVGKKSDLPSIWRSITWKDHDSGARKFSSIREELESLVEIMNKSLQLNPQIKEGEQLESLRLEENTDCIVFKYKLLSIENSSFANADMEIVTESIRTNMISRIHKVAKTILLFRRLMDAQYIFKFEYFDKNGEPFCTVKVVPDDYN